MMIFVAIVEFMLWNVVDIVIVLFVFVVVVVIVFDISVALLLHK